MPAKAHRCLARRSLSGRVRNGQMIGAALMHSPENQADESARARRMLRARRREERRPPPTRRGHLNLRWALVAAMVLGAAPPMGYILLRSQHSAAPPVEKVAEAMPQLTAPAAVSAVPIADAPIAPHAPALATAPALISDDTPSDQPISMLWDGLRARARPLTRMERAEISAVLGPARPAMLVINVAPAQEHLRAGDILLGACAAPPDDQLALRAMLVDVAPLCLEILRERTLIKVSRRGSS